jgi:hypothetical protein
MIFQKLLPGNSGLGVPGNGSLNPWGMFPGILAQEAPQVNEENG